MAYAYQYGESVLFLNEAPSRSVSHDLNRPVFDFKPCMTALNPHQSPRSRIDFGCGGVARKMMYARGHTIAKNANSMPHNPTA